MKISKSFVTFAVAVCTAALMIQAQNVAVIADCESGTNLNNFGAYWYVYSDYNDGGDTRIFNETDNSLVVDNEDGTYEFAPTPDEGNPDGTPGYGARIDYELGNTDPGSGGTTWGSMAGIGTMLALEGEVCDITGAQTITYWAKADKPTTLRVEVATSNVLDAGYYHTIQDVGTSWEKKTIMLSVPLGIDQYSWADDAEWDPSLVTKVQWAVSEDEGNEENSTGTLWIDDVEIQPYSFAAADELDESSISSPGSQPSGAWLLSDMESTKNELNKYAYCYNDAEGREVTSSDEYSSIINDVSISAADSSKPVLVIDKEDPKGHGGTGGAYIEFILGPTFQDGAQTISPFVGIGMNLADDLGLNPFNAEASNIDGLYFEYKTTDDVGTLTFEVESDQDFGNPGAVYYVKLPATDGEWKSASVDFSDLQLPSWDDVTESDLDISKLLKLQWKYQDAAGSEGTVAIDNIYFTGSNISSVQKTDYTVNSFFSVAQHGNMIDVALDLPVSVKTAVISLMDLSGKVVKSVNLSKSSGLNSCSIPVNGVANGLYVLRLKTPDAGSRNRIIPVRIVR